MLLSFLIGSLCLEKKDGKIFLFKPTFFSPVLSLPLVSFLLQLYYNNNVTSDGEKKVFHMITSATFI